MDLRLIDSVRQRLQRHEETVSKSSLLELTVSTLENVSFSRIHCLALGSPTLEFQALYQLAYLRLLAEKFGVSAEKINVYDPVFDQNDLHLLESVLGYRVADVLSEEDTEATLYYMPHAPRSVTETFISRIKPRWILGNDVTVTMGTLGKARFLAEYPTLATLVHLAETEEKETETTQEKVEPKRATEAKESSDGFQVASGRRRGKRKNVYVEPKCDYDLALMYFARITVQRLPSSGNAPWKDSFSDLALNTIFAKPEQK